MQTPLDVASDEGSDLLPMLLFVVVPLREALMQYARHLSPPDSSSFRLDLSEDPHACLAERGEADGALRCVKIRGFPRPHPMSHVLGLDHTRS